MYDIQHNIIHLLILKTRNKLCHRDEMVEVAFTIHSHSGLNLVYWWGPCSSNNKTLNARLLARVITGCHYT